MNKKPGRPSKLENIDMAKVEYYAGLGLTDVEIALLLGISERSLNYYKKDPEFLQSLKKGKLDSDAKVLASLRHKAISGDVTAMIFWLKNRMPDKWRDRRDMGLEAGENLKAILERIITEENPNGKKE